MKKVFLLLLASLILITSIHFKLSAHYCGQQLVDIALFGQAEACSMAAMSTCDVGKMPCCSDREIVIEGEDYLNHKDFSKTEVKRVENDFLQLYYFIKPVPQREIITSIPRIYSPPLIERETSILFQSFLL